MSKSTRIQRLRFASVIAAACVAVALFVPVLRAGQARGFPAPGSCHPRGHGLFVLPDAGCTPGATNPAVTQATIGRTICVSGWSESVRPPESVTEPQKRLALAAYGYYEGRSLGSYEFDHLISISLGGALDSSRNLWPERDYASVSSGSFYLNPKDKLEIKLHALVCDGRMRLATAQKLLAGNWVSGYRKWIGAVAVNPPTNSTASCTVSASYSSTYGDYDVYVHSNQPGTTVTVNDTHGDTASWHTDASGYADVFLHVHGNAAGQRVTVRVGGARCSTAL